MAHGALALRAVLGGTERRTTAAGHALWRSLLALFVVVGLAAAEAQAAGEAYRAAESAYVKALDSVTSRAPTPDDPLWRAAFAAADLSVQAARRELDELRTAHGAGSDEAMEGEAALREALALTARVYGSVGWHSRAFTHWDAFAAEGGEILGRSHPPAGLGGQAASDFPTDLGLATSALSQLAFARYRAGDLEAARAHYLTLLDLDPNNPEALRWLARLAFEEGDTETAIRIWGRLVEVAPNDEGARFFLELSRERDEFGVAASEAYRAGIRAYEAGMLDEAFEQFELAHDANPRFADAAVWAARTALEAGRPAQAEPYWLAALSANPDDQRSAWFLELTRTQIAWGREAANAYYDGQSAYGERDLERAHARFLAAATANPDYVDAWVWAARSSQEAGRAAEAVGLWQQVLELRPGDDRARYFLNLAQQQLEFGPQAGDAFVRGVNAYQVGDVEGARAGFTAAVDAAPTFAAAWSQLGRLEFQVGEFAAAAEAYGRALELEPGNDEYEFFAAEARRLAGAGAAAEVAPEPVEEAPGGELEQEPAPEPEPEQETEPEPEPEPEQQPEPEPEPEQDPDPGNDQPDTEIVPLPPSAPGGQ